MSFNCFNYLYPIVVASHAFHLSLQLCGQKNQHRPLDLRAEMFVKKTGVNLNCGKPINLCDNSHELCDEKENQPNIN